MPAKQNKTKAVQQRNVFLIKDCNLIGIATGVHVQNLREFREGLLKIHPASIYHHFWGRLLQPRFDEPEYSNDFAAWVYHGLNDKVLAERLSVISPTDFDDIEKLRGKLIDICEERLDEIEMVPWSSADKQFHFIRSQIVVFDTERTVEAPMDLPKATRRFTRGSIYYHFIDSRRRTPLNVDDFSAWLSGFNSKYAGLIRDLQALDPFFSSLEIFRKKIISVLEEHFGKDGSS